MITPAELEVPHLELELDVEGHVAEVAALDTDVGHQRSSSHGTWSLGPMWTSSSEMPWSIWLVTDCVFEIFLDFRRSARACS